MIQKAKKKLVNFASYIDGKASSNRMFGLVFAGVFTFFALAPLSKGHDVRWWALGIASLFIVSALAFPHVLAPLNLLWYRFGQLLHRIVSPVMLGLMYFGLFVPFAVFLRMIGRRPLALNFDRKAPSYWILRAPPAPAPNSMKQQF
jgi:hypothetical protein